MPLTMELLPILATQWGVWLCTTVVQQVKNQWLAKATYEFVAKMEHGLDKSHIVNVCVYTILLTQIHGIFEGST